MIQIDRLSDFFSTVVQIDSVSREEAQVAAYLTKEFEKLGASVVMDNAGEAVNGDCGNLIVRFSGTVEAPPLLLSAHMDTVEPGRGIVPVLENGIFTSQGDTILGSDDKSAVAILLEICTVLVENKVPHGPLELVITVCEEIGLLGAKNFDITQISAKYGYALDARDPDGIVTRAPYANRIEFKVHGIDAHAGAKPEDGINAILLASRAIAGLELGRIDEETTCNLGLIKGGVATNIVPGLVEICGEARSHNPDKLKAVTDKMTSAFEQVIKEERSKMADPGDRPFVEYEVFEDFTGINIPDDHPVVVMAKKAGKNLGREVSTRMSGGGADGNVFCSLGVMTGVMGTGMSDVHSTRESVAVADMVKCAELLLEIIKIHAEER
ncbi:peptidase T-like protein [Desulfatibacillum aliphaticivorans]|uniref:Peptidase T-like protein n=1 Tax=Desulfatibacillum aliphaticivorans TaxID=218208 RepID=B8FIQ5_DESAL|nr:M20/M25/M40 family metallo-hydrolase [Desulfatibacillum aliphaticivorans]ACL04296.1 peptidase T-like protein [Desulfatibacillum aliphaticivorans]